MSEARLFAQRPKQPLRLASNHGRVTRDTYGQPPAHPPLVLHYREQGAAVRYLVDEAVCTVGAHPDNVVNLDHPSVSSFHCRLFRRTDGRLWVRDLGSTNGTWLDGGRITEAEVAPGSTLRVGELSVRVEREVLAGLPPALPGIVAHDPVVRPVLELLRRAAPSPVPILLLGESGCGKEVAARAIHELSPRADGPFVPVNCGAVSAELAEAELFGHEKGAFTGAVAAGLGAFGAADGGTLFLDELGDLPLALQVKLLRALESSEVKPVGAARPHKVDVRIVCATHRDLRARVREGTFREDLYYRVAGLSVSLPPLRARQLDILPLAELFLEEMADGVRRTLAKDARELLLGHHWPGNVRELRNVVRLAVIMTEGPIVRRGAIRLETAVSDTVEGMDLRNRPLIVSEPKGYDVPPATLGPLRADDFIDTRGRTLEQIEAMAIRASHERHKGNRKAMMAELGLSKSGLLRKLDLLGLRPQAEEKEE